MQKKDKIIEYIKYIGLLQHYGFGTRLLDISSNYDVAMYFACLSHFHDNGHIYKFNNKDEMKKYESLDGKNVKRKFECIYNPQKIINCDIMDYFIKEKRNIKSKSIKLKTITSNIILKYEDLFKTTIDNIRYEHQSGAFIVVGNSLQNRRLTDEFNKVNYKEIEEIQKCDKMIRLYELFCRGINHTNLFPDDDISMSLVAIDNYLKNSNINDEEKYQFFIKKYIQIYNFIEKNLENINYNSYLSKESNLYKSIINKKICFFFKEFKDFVTDLYSDKNDIKNIIKSNENLTLKELINTIVEERNLNDNR